MIYKCIYKIYKYKFNPLWIYFALILIAILLESHDVCRST